MKQFPVHKVYMLQSTQGLAHPGNLLTPWGCVCFLLRTTDLNSWNYSSLNI